MFRFLHCADLHLDSPLRGLSLQSDLPLDEVRSATRRALINLVNLAIKEKVQFILIAGDIYDGDWEDYSTGLFFNRCMRDLKDAGIPVYVISGNHDATSRITKGLIPPDNVHVLSVDKPETHLLEDEEHGLRVAIHGQGFKTQAVTDNIALLYPPAVPGYFNIGILHTSVNGREGHASYAPCRLEELVEKGYQYWALGHIHKREVLHENPHVVFPGNLQGRHIREEGEKGCTLVTVQEGSVELEHRCVDVLRWISCHVDLQDVEDETELATRLHSAFASIEQRYPELTQIVRVYLRGETELHGRLLADPEWLTSETHNALDVAGRGRMWLEKVKVQTQSPRTRVPSGDMETVLQAIAVASQEQAFRDETVLSLQKLERRLQNAVRQSELEPVAADSEFDAWLHAARDILVQRLLGGGEKL